MLRLLPRSRLLLLPLWFSCEGSLRSSQKVYRLSVGGFMRERYSCGTTAWGRYWECTHTEAAQMCTCAYIHSSARSHTWAHARRAPSHDEMLLVSAVLFTVAHLFWHAVCRRCLFTLHSSYRCSDGITHIFQMKPLVHRRRERDRG